jgi:hypothetical protein
MRAAKALLLLFVAALCSGCAPVSIYLLPMDRPQKTVTTIVQETLTTLTGIPAYSPNLQPNDSFLITALPGIPLTESDLIFSSLSGSKLTGDLMAVDQAYRFANLVNQVLIAGATYERTGIQLSNLYSCLLNSLPAKAISGNGFNDLKLLRMNSPTYNDHFYLTTVTPSVNMHKSWIDYDQTFNQQVTTLALKKGEKLSHLSGSIPSHRFKASLVLLDLQRHSFLVELIKNSRNKDKNTNGCIPQINRPLAVITGLIMAKDIKLDIFPTASEPVNINNSTNITNLQPAEAATSMSSEGPVIIGIIGNLL